MQRKPVLFLYCQHSLGMGHLRRSMEIAKALVNDFRVVFINGGRIPEAIPRPDQIEFIDLPPLGMAADGILTSQAGELNLHAVKDIRRAMIQKHFHRLRPDVLLVELFPFGRKKFAFELLPLLRLAKRSRPKPLVLCDLRDILVDDRRDQQRHDDRACWLSKRYFDAILMHTDPQFARLEESFRPRQTLTMPVIYTGFVVTKYRTSTALQQNPGIVVSAGGGNVGAALFDTAVAAQTSIWQQYKIPMTLVAGPFLPEAAWRQLKQKTRQKTGLTLFHSVPDLQSLLAQATASISQCGYNTAMELLKTRVPALLIPYSEGRENEQGKRALKMEKLGIVRVLTEAQLSVDTLVEEIGRLLTFKPGPIDLQMDGTNKSSAIILQLLADMPDHGGEQHFARLA